LKLNENKMVMWSGAYMIIPDSQRCLKLLDGSEMTVSGHNHRLGEIEFDSSRLPWESAESQNGQDHQAACSLRTMHLQTLLST
jgi:hypothetical protein